MLMLQNVFLASIQDRLGAKTTDDQVSSSQQSVKKKQLATGTKGIFSRLGNQV